MRLAQFPACSFKKLFGELAGLFKQSPKKTLNLNIKRDF